MNFREQEKEVLENELQNFLDNLGYILVDATIIKQSNSNKIRIFIYTKNGVSIEDCIIVSKAIKNDFSGIDKFGEDYTIEVSSPGIGRQLKTIREYRAFTGEKVIITLNDLTIDTKKIIGIIKKVEENNIFIENENNEEKIIPLVNILKGKLYDENM